MDLFKRKKSNGDQSGRQAKAKYENISDFLLNRLSSKQEEIVLSGIRELARAEEMSHKYRPEKVAEALALVLQSSNSEKVAEAAGDALVEKLGREVSLDDANVITGLLVGKQDRNAKFFMKMLDGTKYKAGLRWLAVERLVAFRGAELSPGTVDSIEMALLERMKDKNESEDVKNAIKNRFGKEGRGRPELRKAASRSDETVALDSLPQPVRDSSAVIGRVELPTEGMDVVSGFLLQLKEGDAAQKEKAAKALERLAGNVTSRMQIERIMHGVGQVRNEFPDLYRKVLLEMQKMAPQGESGSLPTALGHANGNGAPAARKGEPTRAKR